jgi:hypothetical protein
MVAQYQALALGPQSSRQPFAFFRAKDNASKLVVHSLGIAVEVRHVLVDHVELTRKSAPCLARLAVAVARSSHIGPRLVYRRVYEEARSIGRARHVTAHHVAVIVDQHHVGRLHRRKVFAKWVCPECMRVLWISHRYYRWRCKVSVGSWKGYGRRCTAAMSLKRRETYCRSVSTDSYRAGGGSISAFSRSIVLKCPLWGSSNGNFEREQLICTGSFLPVPRHALGEALSCKNTKCAGPVRRQGTKSVHAPATCTVPSRTYMCESIHARCLS